MSPMKVAWPLRQGQPPLALQFRERLLPAREPVGVGAEIVGELGRIHALRDQPDVLWRALRVVVEDVAAHGFRARDDGLAPGHDGTVGTDRMQAMHRGDKARTFARWQLAPGQPGNPGRYPRARMQDVGAQFAQQAPQRRHLQQGEQRLALHRQRDVLAALANQLLDLAAPAGNDDRAMARRHQGARGLEGAALDAAGLQRRQDLHDGQARHGLPSRARRAASCSQRTSLALR